MTMPIIAGESRVHVWGPRTSADAYAIRNFLARSIVAYHWQELDSDAEAQELPSVTSLSDPMLSVVELPNGMTMHGATAVRVAEALGFVNAPRHRGYDVPIYGAGPAGLSAAVYAASEGLHTVLIERGTVGGQAGSSSLIENYMGFP